jgi:hypothetical protein
MKISGVSGDMGHADTSNKPDKMLRAKAFFKLIAEVFMNDEL